MTLYIQKLDDTIYIEGKNISIQLRYILVQINIFFHLRFHIYIYKYAYIWGCAAGWEHMCTEQIRGRGHFLYLFLFI